MDTPNDFIHTRIKDKKVTAIINIGGVLVYIMIDTPQDIYGLYVITDRKGVKKPITV